MLPLCEDCISSGDAVEKLTDCGFYVLYPEDVEALRRSGLMAAVERVLFSVTVTIREAEEARRKLRDKYEWCGYEMRRKGGVR